MKRNAGEMGRAHHDERGFSIYPRETAPYRRVFGSQWCQGATDRGVGPSSLTVALLSRADCLPTPVGKRFSNCRRAESTCNDAHANRPIRRSWKVQDPALESSRRALQLEAVSSGDSEFYDDLKARHA